MRNKHNNYNLVTTVNFKPKPNSKSLFRLTSLIRTAEKLTSWPLIQVFRLIFVFSVNHQAEIFAAMSLPKRNYVTRVRAESRS